MTRIMNTAERRYDVFIVHAAADVHLAERLYDLLSSRCTVFLASRSLEPGDVWPVRLADALRVSTAIAILITRNSDTAYYQTEEIAIAISLARKLRKRVIPIYVESSLAQEPPYGLRIIQPITTTENGLVATADQIIHTLHDQPSQTAILEKRVSNTGRSGYVDVGAANTVHSVRSQEAPRPWDVVWRTLLCGNGHEFQMNCDGGTHSRCPRCGEWAFPELLNHVTRTR